ncbi:MAG: hypothetical protein DRO89_01425, partial [Candidatus Altiarchaeales archaeon]
MSNGFFLRRSVIFFLAFLAIISLCGVVVSPSNEYLLGNVKEINRTPEIGLPNPAAVYCREMGYIWKKIKTEEGEEGICVLPDDSSCNAWDFYKGKCGKEFSYCRKQGYEQKISKDCAWANQCTVCILSDGKEKEPLELILSKKKLKASPMKNLFSVYNKSLNKKFLKKETNKNLGDKTIGTPSSFDWRDKDGKNWLTPVRDQGSCGSCWAFSAVGAVEAKYNIVQNNTDLDPDLSEQYLVSSCSGAGDCGGGWHESALEFIKEVGISDEDCFPYQASNSDCSNRCPDWDRRLWRIDDYERVSVNRDIIKQYLMDEGPLSVAMDMTDWLSYGSDCGGVPPNIDHGVVLVGFNDTGQYWIVRNSWGANWGPEGNGYFKVDYGRCGIEDYVYSVDLDKKLGGYVASNTSVFLGQIGEGNLSNTYLIDNCSIRLDEDCNTTSGSCNGLNVSFTFESENMDSLFVFARHNSTVNSTEEKFRLYIYNFLDDVWEFLGLIPRTTSLNLYRICSDDCFKYVSGSNETHVAYYGLNCSSCDEDSVYINWLSIYYENTTEWDGFVSGTEILLVDDDGGADYEQYYENAINNNGYRYSYWNVSFHGSIPSEILSNYSIVIWFTGDRSFNTLTPTDMNNLQNYLDAGNSLFISGQDIGWDINGTSFYSDYLHAQYLRDDTDIFSLEGVAGDPIGDGLNIGISGGDGANNQAWPSEIAPADANSTCVFNYSGDGCGAIRANTSDYRVVYFAFGFEAIDNSQDRNSVMKRVITWLDTTPPTVSFLPPTPESGVETDFSTIIINVSHAEVNPDTLILNWNGTPESYGYSGGYTVITKVVANGFYTYYVWLNDSAGNWNQTEVRNLTVNATPPAVVLISPDNGSFSSGDVNFTCNATDNAQLSSICLYWDYSGVWDADECKNISGTSNSSTFIRENLSDSRILWNCYACDNSSNCVYASENFTVTVDTTMPNIVGYSINPKIVINGSNVSLFMNVTDLHLNRTWAVIELPDSSRVVLDPPADYITNITGRHNVTFFANDSAGNEVNISDYFISKEGMQFNSSSISYNNSGLNVTLRAYFDGSLIAWNQSIGDVALTIANYTYDLQFSTFNSSLIVLLRGVNLSENNNRVIGFDRLDLSGYLVVYAINNSYVIENATLNLSYSGTGYEDKDYLGVYRCADWNFSGRSCRESWEKVTDVSNVPDGEYFLVNVHGFSAFSIKQEPYCGDGVINKAGEECDGSDFGGKTCKSYGYDYGSLSCINCKIYTSGCKYGGGGSSKSSRGHGGSYGAKPMPSCFDGIQNCHDGACEEGIDCGGPCKPCPSCT